MLQTDLNARLASRTLLTPDLSILRIALDSGTPAVFQPGQFVSVGLPSAERPGRLVKRPYSIASAPGESELELYVKRVAGGRLTAQLLDLDPGDRLWADPRILGRFTLDPVPTESVIVAVATGTGLAPFVSMLRHHAPASGAAGRWRRFVLLHGVRSANELGYRAELESRAARDPGFVYLPVVSRDPSWKGARGHVQVLLDPEAFAAEADVTLDPQRTHVFLCGNPAMIEDVLLRLAPLGFRTQRDGQPGHVHFERYW